MQRAPAPVLRPGELVAGRYRVEALIGQGGFGAVFRAMQLPMNRPVALKIVLPHAAGNAEVRARFRRESELAQRLEHPNTVRLYDFGETDQGLPFIVWEHLNGRSLDIVLSTDGSQGVGRAARIGTQILKSLMEAHAKGIIHRDIKPSNVFLCDFSGERDFVKVLDFGIAKAADGQQVTRGGSMLGTPAYMSPEQVSGGAVSAASDTYALGLVLAEIISGKPVFGGDAPLAVAMAQLSDEPAPLPSLVVESPLGPLIVRATQKKAERRFGTAAEMLAALEAVDGGAARASDRSAAADAISAAASAPRTDSADGAASAPTMSASSNPGADASPPEKNWSVVPPTRDDPTLASSSPQGAGGGVASAAKIAATPVARPRALVFVGIGLATLVALTILVTVVRSPKVEPAQRERGDGDARSDPHGDPHGDRATRGRRLANLGPRELRTRFERQGCRVTSETHGAPPIDTIIMGTCNGEMTTLIVAHYPEAMVGVAESSMTAQGYLVVRDGSTLVGVLGRNQKKIADTFR